MITRIVYVIIITLTFLSFVQLLPVSSQEEPKHKKLTDKTEVLVKISRINLDKILADHKRWLKTDQKEGKSAHLYKVNLSKVYLVKENLSKANLSAADLSEAIMNYADLSEAILNYADLSKANLRGAVLRGAFLRDTDLSGADMSDANLNEAVFEPLPESLPSIPSIASARGLSELKYNKSPHALVELREAFKKSGLRRQERELTYAIKTHQRRVLWLRNNINKKLESLFNFIFFEVICAYGMKPGRPLLILLALMPLFAIPYTIALKWPSKREGIWKVWIPDRVRKDLGAEDPVRLNPKFISELWFGFYFSLLSAFSIGWRELNVGNWIARLQTREYTLRATGWVRTVSGFQSLVSVYLLALCVLTYFGRPFEAV